MRDYADDLSALLDAEGVERCAVIGAGFGAEVALELALDAPERVELIVLSGANPPPTTPPTTSPCIPARTVGPSGAASQVASGWAGRRQRGGALANTYLRASVRERYLGKDADAFAAAHEARATRDDLLPRLASLAVPALVVAGEDDPLLPAARLLAETLPNGRLVTLDGCGRGAPFVAPRAFEGALGAFLGDVRAADARP